MRHLVALSLVLACVLAQPYTYKGKTYQNV